MVVSKLHKYIFSRMQMNAAQLDPIEPHHPCPSPPFFIVEPAPKFLRTLRILPNNQTPAKV